MWKPRKSKPSSMCTTRVFSGASRNPKGAITADTCSLKVAGGFGSPQPGGCQAPAPTEQRGDGKTDVHARELPGLPGVEVWAVEGHPACIMHVAGRGWLDPPPDVVLSGINVGANVGRAVLHSTAIGAALTAARHSWRG